jgi:hypothetical protein
MPLDIHLANSLEEAEQQYPLLSIPEELHRTIFVKNKANYMNYKTLCRLSDYYEDTVFYKKDIIDLLKELEAIRDNTKDDEIKLFVNNFIGICVKALEDTTSIYCFCD